MEALRKLAEHCNYGCSLNEMLRDWLVCGIANPTIQKHLLAEPDLTLDKAVSMAQAAELADKGAKELQAGNDKSLKDVHKVSSSGQQRGSHSKDTPPRDKSIGNCYRCGGKHSQSTCHFKSETCHFCGKKGHIAKVCNSKKAQSKPKPPDSSSSRPMNRVVEEPTSSSVTEYGMFTLPSQQNQPLRTTLQVEGHPFIMEIDTGAAVSIISENTFTNCDFLKCLPLQATQAHLRTYTGQCIEVLGEISVKVEALGQSHTLSLLVVKTDGPSLTGRNWLCKLQLDWKSIFSLQGDGTLQHLLQQYSSVFADELGTVKDLKVKLHVMENSTPKFYKARSLPFALREKVTTELNRLLDSGIIVPVQFSDWAAPVVPVLKKDAIVHICGDYKLTINSVAKNEVYPLPRIEELFTSVSGGKFFSKLDLSHAYQQLQLEESSQEYVTVNTHRGPYRYTCLPFGVASASAIFQHTMETLLQELPMVCVYIDDILVAGKTEEEHIAKLRQVLIRLDTAGMRLKKQKCSFSLSEVEYLGHCISAEVLKPSKSKVKAILDAPTLSKVSELKSFLGLVNYYGKFLPNLATVLTPLYKLLRHSQSWKWTSQQHTAFQKVKELLTAPNLLEHFDDTKQLILACDASPYGVGAVCPTSMLTCQDVGQNSPNSIRRGHLPCHLTCLIYNHTGRSETNLVSFCGEAG